MLASSALATILIVPIAGYVTYQMINDRTIVLTDGPIVADKQKEAAVEAYKKKLEALSVKINEERARNPVKTGVVEYDEAPAKLGSKTEPKHVVTKEKADTSVDRADTETMVAGEDKRLATEPKDADDASTATSEMAEPGGRCAGSRQAHDGPADRPAYAQEGA